MVRLSKKAVWDVEDKVAGRPIGYTYHELYAEERWYGGAKYHKVSTVIRIDGSSKVPVTRDAIGRVLTFEKIRDGPNDRTWNFKMTDVRIEGI